MSARRTSSFGYEACCGVGVDIDSPSRVNWKLWHDLVYRHTVGSSETSSVIGNPDRSRISNLQVIRPVLAGEAPSVVLVASSYDAIMEKYFAVTGDNSGDGDGVGDRGSSIRATSNTDKTRHRRSDTDSAGESTEQPERPAPPPPRPSPKESDSQVGTARPCATKDVRFMEPAGGPPPPPTTDRLPASRPPPMQHARRQHSSW